MSKGRDSLVVKLGRGVQHIPLSWLRIFEVPFIAWRSEESKKLPMLFVMSLPRSGSTLTYQVLIHALGLPYLSNLGNLLYQLPLFGGAISAWICRNYSSEFKSDYGYVSGICGPAEGLKFWGYWLGCVLDERVLEQTDTRVRHRRSKYLRRALSTLLQKRAPLVNGFLGHSLDPARLQREFPNAIYIHVKRDIVSTALSILKARRHTGTDWFSLFPRECETALGKGEHAEVAAQVYWLNRRLRDGLRGDNVIVVEYEALCSDPDGQLKRIVEFCNSRGLDVSIRKVLHDAFMHKRIDYNNNEDARVLKSEIEKLSEMYGALS